MSAAVAQAYTDYADANMRQQRDSESLKSKFDRPHATKKPTGDPSCPPHVCRAKHILRDILDRAAAADLSGVSSSEDGNDPQAIAIEGSEVGLGDRPDNRPHGATGRPVPSRKMKQGNAVIRCMESMVQHMGSITSVLSHDATDDIQSAVQVEVAKAMEQTNKSMNGMKTILTSITNKVNSKIDRSK